MEEPTKWHGENLEEAKTRARRLGGKVVRSWAPKCLPEEDYWGFYSEPKGACYLLRVGEEIVVDFSKAPA